MTSRMGESHGRCMTTNAPTAAPVTRADSTCALGSEERKGVSGGDAACQDCQCAGQVGGRQSGHSEPLDGAALDTQRRSRDHEHAQLDVRERLLSVSSHVDQQAEECDQLEGQRAGDRPWPHRVVWCMHTCDVRPNE